MAALTWRNVDAPDIGNSMRGFEKFSQMLNSAIGTAKTGVNEFDNITTDNVNKALAMRLASEQGTAEDYKAGLPDLLAEFSQYGPQRVSYENLTAANAKVGQLANQELTGLNIEGRKLSMGDEAYARERSRTRDGAMDALAPITAQITALRLAGQDNQADALMASPEYTTLMSQKGISAQDNLALARDFQGLETGELGIESQKQSIAHSGTRFGWDKDDRADAVAVDDAIAGFINSSTNMDEYRAAVQGSKLTGRQKSLALSKGPNYQSYIDVAASGGFTGAGSSPPVGFGGGAGTEVQHKAVAGVLSGGGLSDPVVAGFLGNFAVEGGFGGALGDNGTASGIAQWRKERRTAFKQRNDGVDPSKASPEAQAKHVLWELTTPEGRKSAGISKAQADQIKAAKTPEQAAELIDKYYERSDGTHRNKRVATATNMFSMLTSGQASQAAKGVTAVVARSQNASLINQVNDMTMTGWNSNSTAAEVVRGLVGEGGAYQGGSVQSLMKSVRNAMSAYELNAAEAGALVAASADEQSWTTMFKNGFGLGSGDFSVNETKFREYGTAFKDPKARAEAAALRERGNQAIIGSENAAGQLAAAEARVSQLITAKRNGRDVTAQLNRAVQDLEMAKAAAGQAGVAGLNVGLAGGR
jgi:hypothetical protein